MDRCLHQDQRCRGPLAVLASVGSALVLATACGPALNAASAAEPASPARSGQVDFTSLFSEVDACNQAQKLLPASSIATAMHYWRSSSNGQASVTCRVRWSTAADARPTGRPILFGPSL